MRFTTSHPTDAYSFAPGDRIRINGDGSTYVVTESVTVGCIGGDIVMHRASWLRRFWWWLGRQAHFVWRSRPRGTQ